MLAVFGIGSWQPLFFRKQENKVLPALEATNGIPFPRSMLKAKRTANSNGQLLLFGTKQYINDLRNADKYILLANHAKSKPP